jgi:hypothetical protein
MKFVVVVKGKTFVASTVEAAKDIKEMAEKSGYECSEVNKYEGSRTA